MANKPFPKPFTLPPPTTIPLPPSQQQSPALGNTVSNAEIEDLALTNAKISNTAGIVESKLALAYGTATLKGLVDTNTTKNTYPSADSSKLAAIEANAKDDQSAAEVAFSDVKITATDVSGALIENRTAIDLNTAKITYPSADSTKLSGIEANATVDQKILEIGKPADEEFEGLTTTGTSGEALVEGDPIYLKSDGKYWKANAITGTAQKATALCVESVAVDTTFTALLDGIYRDDSRYAFATVGATIYLDDSAAGKISQTAPSDSGDLIQNLGYAIDADTIYFRPDLMPFVRP